MMDDLDRQIIAALIRNGRAPFRLIAEVLGQQERTVARRAKKLLAAGHVRVQAFPSPAALSRGNIYMLRVSAVPDRMNALAAWLSVRSETHWISTLSGANECIVELFLDPAAIESFLYTELAGQLGVLGFRLDPVFEYYRTVSGWRPDVLDTEQYDRLSAGEMPQRVTRYAELAGSTVQAPERILIELLRGNGRITIEEIAAELGVAKATASRRLETLIAEGVIYVRAILDPATLGYPVEGLLSVQADTAVLDAIGAYIADKPTVRWAANTAETILVQCATRNHAELQELMREIGAQPGVRQLELSLFAEIYKRSTVAYRDGQLPPL